MSTESHNGQLRGSGAYQGFLRGSAAQIGALTRAKAQNESPNNNAGERHSIDLAVRLNSAAHNPRREEWPHLGALGGSSLRSSFQCSLTTRPPVSPETEPVRQIKITEGYRAIRGSAPESVSETLVDATEDGFLCCVFTYSTDGAVGAWATPFWTFGALPSASGAEVIIHAELSGGVLIAHHLGDVTVTDMPPIPLSKYQVLTSRNATSNWNRWVSGWLRAH